jgi:hypothetical protein
MQRKKFKEKLSGFVKTDNPISPWFALCNYALEGG